MTGGQSSAISAIVNGTEYANYDVSPNAGGYTLTMKQAAIRDAKTHTVDVTIEAIRQRIDSLGVAEPAYQGVETRGVCPQNPLAPSQAAA